MGQRVILLKTIQGILRERQTVGDGQREKEDEWEERQIGDDTERGSSEKDGERETDRKR